MRWEWVVVSSTAVLVVSAGLAQKMGPEGDEATFHAYVIDHLTPRGHFRDELWVASHEDLVLAEGYRACEWLAKRPSVDVLDPAGGSDVAQLVTSYLAEAERQGSPLSKVGERTLVAGAWAHLCESVRDDATAPRSPPHGG